MQSTNLYLAGTGASLPRAVTVANAVEHGLYDAGRAERTQQLAVTVADLPAGDSAPAFAAAAARHALASSAHSPADVALVLHSVVCHAGLDLWNSAAYVARHAGVRDRHTAFAELRTGCDAALLAVDLASAYLQTHPAKPAALITAADVWPEPTFDRWSSNSSLVFGDGGAALLLSRKSGFARILSTSTAGDPDLEELDRGEEPFMPFANHAGNPFDVPSRFRHYLTTVDKEDVWRRQRILVRDAVDRACADAEITLADVRHVVMPFVGAHSLDRDHLAPLGLTLAAATSFEYGRRVGHLGAADVLVGLHHLRDAGRLAPGDITLLLAQGSGHIVTAVLLESL
jgi:3-oxoacyl-[acyl-carrier-protein] synthase III